jgi:hypothetical protein
MKIKKILITIICLLIFSFSIYANSDSNQNPDSNPTNPTQQPDFRQFNWGTNQNEVFKLEKSQFVVSGENLLYYTTKIANRSCILFYSFMNNNKLESAGYMFDIKHFNQNDYIEDYSVLKDLINSKYSKLGKEDVNWKNKTYKNYPEYYGTAIGMGYLIFRTFWEIDEKTKILLALYGDNLEISLALVYYDKSYVETNKYLPSSEGL